MLVRKGRYELGQPVETWRWDLLEAGLQEAPLEGLAAAMAGMNNALHEDPADRFIAATSIRLGASLVTSDRRLLTWASTTSGIAPLDART